MAVTVSAVRVQTPSTVEASTAYELGLAWFQANTGVPAGTSLTSAGTTTLSSAGAVVQDMDYTGPVTVSAASVTLRRCQFRSTVTVNGADALIEDCTFTLPNDSGGLYGNSTGLIVRRVASVGGGEHYRLTNDTTLERCYSHGLTAVDAGRHAENLISGGGSGCVIRNCWFDSDAAGLPSRYQMTAAVNMSGWAAPFDGWLLEGNHLRGNGYLLYTGRGGPNTYRANTFDLSVTQCYGAVYPTTLPAADTWDANTLQPAGTTVPRPGG